MGRIEDAHILFPSGFSRIEAGLGFVRGKKTHLSIRKLKSCIVWGLATFPFNKGEGGVVEEGGN